MRARNVGLAVMIILVGSAISAYYRGGFDRLRRGVESWSESWDCDLGGSPRRWEPADRSTQSLAVADAVLLRVANGLGEVVVRPTDDQQVRVIAQRYWRARRDAPREPRLRAIPERQGQAIVVEVNAGDQTERLDLEIAVPRRLTVEVGTASGSITVEEAAVARVNSTSGDVEVLRAGRAVVSTASGDVSLADVAGEVTVTSVSGDIHADLLGKGPLRLRTASGDIGITSAAGPLTVSSVSGDVTIEGFDGPRAELRTTSGDVQATLHQPRCGLTGRSVSGNLTFSLPPRVGADYDLGTLSGDVTVGGSTLGHSARSRLPGEGGITISAYTTSGSIELVTPTPPPAKPRPAAAT